MRAYSAIVLALVLSGRAAADAALPFVETFDRDAADRWTVMTGDWSFGDGRATQSAGDFDCGAGLNDVRVAQPYWLAVRFKPNASFNGGGVFFGLPDPGRKHGGSMVRCDPGGRVLYGDFNPVGEFEYGGDVQVPDIADVQELAVAVDPAKFSYNIYFNAKRVATAIPADDLAGFVGIQTSGGPHEFTRVELRPATPDELEGLKAPGPLSRMTNLIGDHERIVVLRRSTQFLVAFDGEGEQIGSATVDALRGLPANQRFEPVDLCWKTATDARKRQGLLVLAEGGRAIYEFDADLKQVGDGPLVRMPAMQAFALATDDAGRIFIIDRDLGGVRIFADSGDPLATYGRKWQKGDPGVDYARPDGRAAGLFKQPMDIAVREDGLIAVTDRTNYTYYCYRFDSEAQSLRWVSNGPWLPNPEGVDFDRQGRLLLGGTYEFYRSFGALRVLQLDGRSVNVYCGFALNDLSDKVRACQGPENRYYLIDPKKDRIVVLPEHFVEKLPEFEYLPDGGVKLTLTRTDGVKMTSTHHETSAADDGRIVMQPPAPTAEVWPKNEPVDLRSYALPPKPPAGKTYVIDMPVLVAVYAKGRDNDGKLTEIDPTGVAERMADELDMDRQFYWRVSHGILNKQFEIMVVDDVVAPIDGPWINPSEGRRLTNEVRAKRGLPPIDNDHSLVCIHPMEGFDAAARDDLGYVGGGGLTPYAYSGYALWNHGQGWLMGHEWGHQLDSYFEKSGVTNWWLNHPDGTVHVGRYGEHWDCNAYLCQRVDPLNWLRFRFGEMRLTDDADGDGLPDNDPALPLDEKRFGSDPTKADTDGDGLADLAEMTAGTFTSSDPRKVDSDGDGAPDGRDGYPQFAVSESIGEFVPMPGDPPVTELYTKIGRIENRWADADVYGAWDSDHVYLAIVLRKAADAVHATVDFDNDGWFIGRDNVYARANFAVAGEELKLDRAYDCEAAAVADLDHPAIRLTVKRPAGRQPLRIGSSVGVTVRLTLGGGTAAFLIDPWQILGLELK